MRTHLIQAAGLLLALAIPTMAASQAAQTPDSVWQRAGDSYRVGDFRSYYRCMSPDTRHRLFKVELALYLGLGVARRPDADTLFAEVATLFSKHGVEGMDRMDMTAFGSSKSFSRVADPEGLFVETMAWFGGHGMGPRVPTWLETRLEKLKVHGSQATAEVSQEDLPRKKLHFRRIGTVWYLDYPFEELE